MESNPILDKLPAHLKVFIKDQEYERYTPVDQAVWRYVMRVNVDHLSKVAHESYISGLVKAGLEVENIAHLYGMNRILKEIGWAAVAVDGFIPPSAFMEFQAWKVLVIASDIRQLKHIEYTPAPDIIHEAAGHAPIIANPEYAEYLRYFGEIGAKALGSARDFELYEAIRHLSIIKEYPYTLPEDIQKAEKRIEEIQQCMGEPSEMALIRRLHWWTVEYGLIGTLSDPKIYGAGLLSSIGESVSCMDPSVNKIPYTLDAIHVEFDITRKQPQLFVTPDFKHLTTVLDQFADGMALRKGGSYGLRKAIESGNIATAVLSSGLQISGIFSTFVEGTGLQPAIFRTSGPTALASKDRELKGHGKSNYESGFVAVIGLIEGIDTLPQLLSDAELLLDDGTSVDKTLLKWKSGVQLSGVVDQVFRNDQGSILYIRIMDGEITYKGASYLRGPVLNLTMADEVISVYSGSADREAFGDFPPAPLEKTSRVEYTAETRQLQSLYSEVRSIRHSTVDFRRLMAIFRTVSVDYPDDWLLSMEICELLVNDASSAENYRVVRDWLEKKSVQYPGYANLIDDGLRLIDESNLVKAVW